MAYLNVLVVTSALIATGSGFRADLRDGFKKCPGKQLGRLVAVEADGPGCKNRHGKPQWPCFVYPGRRAGFSVSFEHKKQTFEDINYSIHGIVKLRFRLNKEHIGLRNEVNQDACPHTYYQRAGVPVYGCPIQPNIVYTIQKDVFIPRSLRFTQSNIEIEFKITNKSGDNIICFISPMLIP